MGREQIVLGQATRPVVLISDAEATFLQAEAILRGWLAGNAQTAYETGVILSFRLAAGTHLGSQATATVGQADAAAVAYYTGGTLWADWSLATTTAIKLKTIWVQKWEALCNMDGAEAWAEYRRTNGPVNANGINPDGNCPSTPHSIAVGGTEPVRFFYPLREENVNGANVPQGINVFTSRIFWDIN